MAANSTKKPKHIPQRTCVGCRQVLAKRNLIRIVRSEEHVKIDLTGKLAGRGAYLHDKKSCWEKGLKGSLSGALRASISEQDKALLLAYMENLEEDIDPVVVTSSKGTPDKGGSMA